MIIAGYVPIRSGEKRMTVRRMIWQMIVSGGLLIGTIFAAKFILDAVIIYK